MGVVCGWSFVIFSSLDNESLSNSELEVAFNEMAGLVFQGVSVEVTSGDSIPQ